MMQRRSDWRRRFGAYIEMAMRVPFRPGQHDCALFAAGAVEAITGTDLARGYRGYRTLNEGRSKLAKAGFDELSALVAEKLPEIPVALSRPGDLAILRDEAGGEAFGVVQGGQIYVLRPTGLGLVPLLDAERAFRV